MQVVIAITVSLLVWWLATCLILRALRSVSTSRTGERWVFLGATVGLVVGIIGAALTPQMQTVTGAYLGFASALLIWIWQEVAFLLGLLTGPNRSPCPGVGGWPRFWLAVKTVAYQEMALLAHAIAVVMPAWDAPNQTAAGTYLVLWLMRLSAKLNIYVGVKNFYESFLPSRLHYLLTYFRRRQFTYFFVLSMVCAGAALFWVWGMASTPGADDFIVVGFSLVGAMLALAMIEHLMLMLPCDPSRLWRWALGSPSK